MPEQVLSLQDIQWRELIATGNARMNKSLTLIGPATLVASVAFLAIAALAVLPAPRHGGDEE